MLHFLAFITVILCTFILIRAIIYLSNNNNQSIFFVYIVFYIFFVIPIILDYLLGIPTYYKYPGLYLASQDYRTNVVYYLYMIFTALFWWIFAKRRKGIQLNYKLDFKNQLLVKLKPLMYLLLVVPFILVLLSPDPTVYLNYAASAKGLLTQEEVKVYHSFLLLVCRFTMIAAGLLLVISTRKNYIKVLTICVPFLFLVIWIYGKRSIVAAILVIIIYSIWSKGFLKGYKFLFVGLSFVCLLVMFSFIYQQNVRYDSFQINTENEVYENIRIDYGRDDVTKFSIYKELNKNDTKILEYRGQSFLFYFTAYIPREIWNEKPYPYAVYFTNSVFNLKAEPLGWGLTTSVLEETISNFSWFGVLIGPFIVLLMCRLGDSKNDPLISLLTLYCTVLILVQHLIAFYGVFLLWLLLVIFKRKNKIIDIK